MAYGRETTGATGRIAPGAVAVMCLLGWGLMLARLSGAGWAGALTVTVRDGSVALGIFLSAGGWGWLALRRLLPSTAPAGLRVVTCIGAGLWLLGTGLLALGTWLPGGLSPWLWWPVVLAGVALGAWAVHRPARQIRVPAQVEGTNVFWVAAAVGGAFWIAGAAMPPGLVGMATGDFWDVVSYHLQIPREFHDAGRIHPLPHNTYSFYPLGSHMLFLLGMILRGGPWAGMYAAKLTHGLWGVLAVASVATGLPPAQAWRRRSAGVLLATTPLALYLSWLAFVELAELAYLAIGIAWLRWWWSAPTRGDGARAALLTGLSAGGACAVKYLSVGLVAGPLLAAGVVTALRRRRGAELVPLLAGCALLAAPWLIRNYAYTGNPVFPLATGLLGRGHWSVQSAQRWDAAHAPAPWPQKLPLLAAGLIGRAGDERAIGLLMVLLTGGAIVAMLRRPRKSDAVDWLCLGILVAQLAVWALATHMPARFIIPAAVPMAVLAGGFTQHLGGWVSAPRRAARDAAPPPPAPTGVVLGGVLVLATAAFHLVLAGQLWRQEPYAHFSGPEGPVRFQGMGLEEFAAAPQARVLAEQVGPNQRVLMLADVRPFLFPQQVEYYTVWEEGPLVRIARRTRDGHEVIAALRQRGITHLWIGWNMITRYRRSGNYGWWEELDEALVDSLLAAGAEPIDLSGGEEASRQLAPNGRPMVELLALPAVASQPSGRQ